MINNHLTLQKQEQGFQNQHIQIKNFQPPQQQQPIKFNFPSARQIITIERPLDYFPRILQKDPALKLLPLYTEMNSNLIELSSKNYTDQQIVPKRILSGAGKILYEYFEDSYFRCIYQKYKNWRTQQQKAYDFTAKIKIIELNNDYDQKMYKKLENTYDKQQMQEQISFDANFQSGNLSYVFQHILNHQYYLLTQNDSNTHGYNHWFFFRVKNKSKCNISLHIMNMIKKSSLYRSGMKVSIFSEKKYEKFNIGWHRGGNNISYYNTKIQRTTKQNQTYYNLTFSYQFQEQNDTVYFALNNPYTYSKLIHYLEKIQRTIYKQETSFANQCIGYTVANNAIPAVTITNNNQIQKKVLIFLARQHPGETVGSYVCEGIFEFFTQKSIESNFLLNKFRIVIIPMVNPDGVIYGHSRCNLAGLDLNRQWGNQIFKELTPETFYIKKYINSLEQSYGIECMIDLHGHSKKMNSFFYACKQENKITMRLLSVLMSKFSSSFQLFGCKYGVTRDKVNTIRSQFYNLKVNAFTLQNSYFGTQKDNLKRHYTDLSLKDIGKSLIKSLFVCYCQQNQSMNLYNISRNKILEQIQTNLKKYELEQYKYKNDSGGSQSDPDGDLLVFEQRIKTFLITDKVKQKKIIKLMAQSGNKIKFQSSLVKKYKLTQKSHNKTSTLMAKVDNIKLIKKQKSQKSLKRIK